MFSRLEVLLPDGRGGDRWSWAAAIVADRDFVVPALLPVPVFTPFICRADIAL